MAKVSPKVQDLFPFAPSLQAIEDTLETNPALSTLLLHSVNELCRMRVHRLPPVDLFYINEWLQDLWTLLHRNPAVQNAFLAAEYRELSTVQDVARHTADHLQGRAYASWSNRGPIYPETIPLTEPLVRLQRLGFLTSQGQPSECARARFVHGRWYEHRQRAFVEGLLPAKYVKALVAHLDTLRGSVGYDFVTADGKKYSSRDPFPFNRERFLDARRAPASPWYLDTRPLRLWEPDGRHHRLSLEALGGVADQVFNIAVLNPRVGDAVTRAQYAYGFIFVKKACSGTVDPLQVLSDFLSAHVPPAERAREDHVLTLYAALLNMRTRVKAAMALYKDPRRKPSDKARERLLYERAHERQVRAEAAALDVVVRLPPKW
jgi:hypothetical protein